MTHLRCEYIEHENLLEDALAMRELRREVKEGKVAIIPTKPSKSVLDAMRSEYGGLAFVPGNPWPVVYKAMIAAAPTHKCLEE